MPKNFDIQNLFQDLEYTLFGTEAHAFLFRVFPPGENKRVLEAGCGCGKFGIAYALLGCDATMIDVDKQVLTYARRIRNAANSLNGHAALTHIWPRSVHEMGYEDNSFDLVFNEGVPQHWTTEELRQGCIDKMVKISRDTVIVMGNNGLREEEQEVDRSFTFTYEEMPPRRKCFTPDELEMRLKKAGLKGVQVEGVSPGKIENSYLIGGYGFKRT